MKAVILAGGYGTRLSEETSVKPKPMVEIGGRPILWHIMQGYAHHGVTDFVICLGHMGHVIKEYFANYYLHHANVSFDLARNTMEVHESVVDPWKVTLVDTGHETMTGGRIKRIRPFIGDERFCMTYGDGVSDLNIGALIAFHAEQGALATLTAVQPPGRFGALTLGETENRIRSFREKPDGDGAFINGGFFVLEPGIFDYIDGDETVWEREPLERLAVDNELAVYRHRGFWQNMDTLRDKNYLEKRWATDAPWRTWSAPVTAGRP